MGRSEKRKDIFGNTYYEHYKDGEIFSSGRSDERTDVWGNKYLVHYNNDSIISTGKSYQRTDIFGNSYWVHDNNKPDNSGEKDGGAQSHSSTSPSGTYNYSVGESGSPILSFFKIIWFIVAIIAVCSIASGLIPSPYPRSTQQTARNVNVSPTLNKPIPVIPDIKTDPRLKNMPFFPGVDVTIIANDNDIVRFTQFMLYNENKFISIRLEGSTKKIIKNNNIIAMNNLRLQLVGNQYKQEVRDNTIAIEGIFYVTIPTDKDLYISDVRGDKKLTVVILESFKRS